MTTLTATLKPTIEATITGSIIGPGIPATTAVIAPTAPDVLEGTVINFVCTAGGGEAPYAYQWALNGAAIGGATSSTYNRTALDTDDGKSITCLVTPTAGNPALSNAAFMSVTPSPRGEQIFTSSGTFTVPTNVTSVCAVAIGRGGFSRGTFGRDGCGGGGLGWQNNVAVTPGQNIAVTIDNTSSRIAGFTARGDRPTGKAGGGRGGDGGGNGGAGGGGAAGVQGQNVTGGSGGAGGYSGNGGKGGEHGESNQNGNSGSAGAGGGSGGGGGAGNYGENQNRYGGNGGGTGIFGQGSNGAGGSAFGQQGNPGGGGSGGSSNATYGGGGSPSQFQPGPQPAGAGVVRILWGAGRAFPSTDVGAT